MKPERVEKTGTHVSPHSAVSVCAMTVDDIPEVLAFLKPFNGVALCDWEDHRVLARVLDQSPNISFVARDGTHVIGALIGGMMGIRGTINHLAIDEHYQSQGIGRTLVTHALEGFRAVGIHRIFLFVLCDQLAALAF